ncbi:unnamed protein product [Arabidopsis halleri]
MAQPSSSALTPNETESSGAFNSQTLMPLINRARPLAHALLSQAPLVAVGRGSSGRTFLGVNVELRGLPLNQSIRPEQFLVVNLALNNERKLNCLAISADGSYFFPPCGHSCEFLQEIRDASNIQILITDPIHKNVITNKSLSTFLPQKFPPYYVVPGNFPRLLDDNRNNGLTLINPNLTREICVNSDRCNHLKCRALNAANRSYAPYSGCPSGVALMDSQGKVYSGWRMESMAFNPSLGPVQAALVDFMTNGGGKDFKKIVQAVLVERVALLSQEATAKMILEEIAHHNCVLSVLHCH